MMLRKITRPSTAHCNLNKYMGFLICEPKSPTCTRLSEIMGISHDSINRFLERESFEPVDLFNHTKNHLNLKGGIVSVDDTVLDKPYAHQMALLGHFWSGKHHRTVKGINLITLYYTDLNGVSLPVSFRLYDKSEGKSKNDYFQDMLDEVMSWGLEPEYVTGDSWYSGTVNLKKIKNHQIGFLFAVKSNRTVSINKGSWIQVQHINVPEDGIDVWLKDFGFVRLFRTHLKDELRHYIVYQPDINIALSKKDFLHIHDKHWEIEQYHRALKQLCHVEHFQVRNEQPIRNHIFAAIFSFCHLQRMKTMELISNIYQHQKSLFKEVIASFINTFCKDKNDLQPKFIGSVNA